MNISLVGKHALVGGSSRGIGRAIAEELAACGASVTLMARNREKLMEIVSKLPTNQGQKHEYLVADITHFGTFKNIIQAHIKEFPVDILVNNTPGPAPGFVLEKNEDDFAEAFDLLFKTICHITLEAVPYMRKKGFGRIINVTSVTVKEPKPELVLSNSIRSAIVSWAKSLSQELASDGITVNNILTGYFDTERLDEVNNKKSERSGKSIEDLKKEMAESVPMGRIGDPKEFGYLCAFLASDKAAYINGASIPIDGGILRSV
ncbi:SDR family oxidoreductase [Robertkochia solimangrovi]|uniref:SDR family oxidoreductase n=1 Tax=Robertkochia solimangrovi TaxID=2213046 RepID=UPI00117DC587|nr:SDR family oxidoreductase [Robertkochia solimangrovi]TRZ42722.1 SDR family NAD(P)-dependent oxidoreductase [Robertkochia solimangrovi]